MKTFVAAVAVLLVLGAAYRVPPAALARKCASTPVLFRDAPEPVFVLDGKQVDEATIQALEPSTVQRVQIMCADDLFAVFNVKAQRSGVVVFTVPGPRAQLRTSVDSIARLQEAYFKEHGVFARDAGELGWSDATGLVTIELQIADGGARWTAVGSHRFLIGSSSTVSVTGSSR